MLLFATDLIQGFNNLRWKIKKLAFEPENQCDFPSAIFFGGWNLGKRRFEIGLLAHQCGGKKRNSHS